MTFNTIGAEQYQDEDVESLKLLAQDMIKVQSEMKHAKLDGVNSFYNGSKYATLTSIWDACRDALTKNGFSVIQLMNGLDSDSNISLDTILLHKSGESIKSKTFMRPKDTSPQSICAATTYVRRYSLAAIVGVSVEDDDGNIASGIPNSTPKKTKTYSSSKPAPVESSAKCKTCEIAITSDVASYSKNNFGVHLCRVHQKDYQS